MNEFGKQLEGQKQKLNGTAEKINYTDKMYYNRFTDDLSLFYKSGSVPKLLGQDEKFLLEFKRKKLESLGVEAVEDISSLPFSETGGEVFSDQKYIFKRLSKAFKRKITLNSDKGKSYEKKQNIFIDADMIFPQPNSVADEEKLNCPYCGEISGLKELENGCSGCGRNSYITNLFPKTKSFFYRKSNTISVLDIGKIVFVCCLISFFLAIPFGISAFIEDISARFTEDTIRNSIANVFNFPFRGVMAGLLLSVFIIIFRLIQDNVKISAFFNKTLECKTKIKKEMQKNGKPFSFENFESRVIFLVKLLIWGDDREKLVCLNLKHPVREFNIVDSVYRGFMDLKFIHIENNICEVSLDIYMSDIYFDGKKFIPKEEVFNIVLKHQIPVKNDIGFEISNVTCPLCKEHFDAFTDKECSFCGKEYDTELSDWTVTEFKLK